VVIKVLVTGAYGMLGSQLVPYLRGRGYQVTAHARKGNADVCSDLSNADQTITALDAVQPEVIVNLAALADVDECERSPQSAYLANVRIVENLAKWMTREGTHHHLIHVSTDQVYDGAGCHREDDINLRNYYAFSKYAGELAATKVPRTVLRTNFFGPSRCGGRVSLSDWLVRSLSSGNAITVFDDVHFTPLALQRVAELVELAVERRSEGTFNLGSKGGMSKADFAFMLAKMLGLPTATMSRGSSTDVKLSAYRPKNMCMDSSHFEEVFGVQLPTLADEIESMKAAYA
jgi:dTDP-4-dehydrorhamnose reductase